MDTTLGRYAVRHLLLGVLVVLGVAFRIGSADGFTASSVVTLAAGVAGYLVCVRWGCWRWLAALAALMVPWTAYVSAVLPYTARAAHFDLAWGGFDFALLVLLALTSPTPDERWVALAMALLVELPLAVVCGWLAVSGQDLVERLALDPGRHQADPVRRTPQ